MAVKLMRLIAVAAVAALGLVEILAQAQGFPSKTVHIVVPYPPGGQVDLLARVLAERLEKAWGSSVIVEYKAGFAGNLGIEYVAKAQPDGHTLVIAPAGNLSISPHLHSNLRYNVFKDLAPVTMLATADNVLVVGKQLPARSVAELLAYGRANPGKLSFASSGAGSQAHVAGELLKLQTGVDMLHVAYKGGGPAVTDLLGGRISMMFLQISIALPHIKSGALQPIGIAKLKRSPTLPDVPTIDEQGLRGFEALSWYALMAPAGTPRDVVSKISAQVTDILRQSEIRQRLTELAVDPAGGTPEELASYIQAEWKRWEKVVRDAKISPLD
jgi:tripartite-type tricarboxylate transporter receptor subunit TctC